MNGKTILLVEDNREVTRNNTMVLESHGAAVLSASTITEARNLIEYNSFDAAVLDIMLPDGSGLDLLREIRAVSDLPVLLLTAKGDSEDIVSGLTLGADDYLAKPYYLNVFTARIDALLRRAGRINENVTIGRLRFHLPSNQAFYGGTDLLLTQKEFALLFLFAQHEREILTAEYLFEKVWGQPLNENTATFKVQMSNLKKKLSVVTADVVIETARGEGYTLTML